MRVFISFAGEDRDTAEQIHLALEGAGFLTFFDKTSLPSAGDFHARIRAAVAESDFFVFLISTQSIERGTYARTELKYAQSKWRHPAERVLPVALQQVDLALIPNYLKAVTILEPEGNVAAEVVHAVRAMAATVRVEQAVSATAGLDGKRDENARTPDPEASGSPFPQTTGRPRAPAIASGIVLILLVAALVYFRGFRNEADDNPPASRATPQVMDASPPPPVVPAAPAPAGPELGAARALRDLWCTSRSSEGNPLLARGAELARPKYSIDPTRHLLLNSDGTPVSLAPATSLGKLEDRQLLVAHFSAGPDQGVAAYFQQPGVNASVHVMIARDGSVKQLVPFDFAAHHAGQGTWRGLSGLNRHSIGIDLENFGKLQRVDGEWRAGSTIVPADEVVVETSADGSEVGWQKYEDAQLRAFFGVACILRRTYPSIVDLVGHDQIQPGRKLDPGPAFPMTEMRRRLFIGSEPPDAQEERAGD